MRLFIAIPLPDDLRATLGRLSGGLPGARWVAPHNMHLSLRFFADVEQPETEELNARLAALRIPGFDVILSGMGCFTSGRQISALWCGVDDPQPLKELNKRIEQAVVSGGFEPEHRRYSPHVTLARFKTGSRGRKKRSHRDQPGRIGQFIETHNGFRAPPFTVESFTLFRSHLGGQGPHYEALAQYQLD